VIILNNTTYLTYTLIDSGASHSFIDEGFVYILDLVSQVSGFIVVLTTDGY
jgi:general stress protein CsbA